MKTHTGSESTAVRHTVLAGLFSVLAGATAILGSGAAIASPLSTVPHNAHVTSGVQ